MREILFKAKRKNNGEWVEGDAIHELIGMSIKNDKNGMRVRVLVDPDTLCQFTGLTDKNGNRIWENDIVEILKEDGRFICEWNEDTASFVMKGKHLLVDFDNYWSHQVEVIGNIFDNADLLEVE